MDNTIESSEDILFLLEKVYARIIEPEDAYELITEFLENESSSQFLFGTLL